jgi:hypothetical protein
MSRKEFLKQTYEVASLSKREKIDEEYKGVEGIINDFYEGKEAVKEMSDQLGNVVLGAHDEHASTQLYAYEVLLKSLAEIDPGNKKAVEAVVNEALFDAAVVSHPVKKEYLLGILQYYSSKDHLEEINKIMSMGQKNARLERESQIIININSVIEQFKDDPLVTQVAKYIIDNFPRDNPECQKARLIAKYYEAANSAAAADLSGKTPRATEKPGIPEELDNLINNKKLRTGLGSSGVPDKIVCLTVDYHPSQEKLDESDTWGTDLVPLAAAFEDVQMATPGGIKIVRKRRFVEYDISPELTRLYLRRIRYYKDRNQLKKVGKLEEALRERIWRGLNERFPDVAGKIGRKEDMVVIKRTIRDLPMSVQQPGRESKSLVTEEEFKELLSEPSLV